MKKLMLLLGCCGWLGTAWGQTTKRVLFLGNSYTYYNSLPAMVAQMAQSLGDSVYADSYAVGGYTFQQHGSDATSLAKIRQGGWDFVVLQEQSQRPAFPPSQVQTQVYPYAQALNDSVELYNACAETVFFMTWGRVNGDQANCGFYTPLCTYAGMQQRLRESYLEMARDNAGICAPVGAAWQVVRDSFPSLNLYDSDGSHPSYAGSYLASCVFYASLFGKTPVGSTFYGSLSAGDALTLQRIAARVVLDSAATWYMGAYDVQADFNAQIGLDSVVAVNASQGATVVEWLVDGVVYRGDTMQHVFADTGNYVIRLVASDTLCGRSDTSYQTVSIAQTRHTTTSVQTANSFATVFYPNPIQLGALVQWQTAQTWQELRIWNAQGCIQQVVSLQKGQTQASVSVAAGIYWAELTNDAGARFVSRLVVLP